jgi:hypothetical protein
MTAYIVTDLTQYLQFLIPGMGAEATARYRNIPNTKR